jgi:hypothetical protein
VPTIRHPASLAEAAELAQKLDCTLVTLHSKGWTSAARAAQRLARSVDLIAIDVPDAASLRLPAWDTSKLLAGTAFAQWNTDLSLKRNLGLLLSRVLGWERIMFLDDDIAELNPADVEQASGLLDTYNAVGLNVGGFPDHSVVCHAYRQAGGDQTAFIGGGALVVQVERCWSFFPEIYNDDWFFLLDGAKGLQPVASTGRVRQHPYDPFRSPERARNEEFGDVLAEGIYWLLDQGRSIIDADEAHWARFLIRRGQFIRRVLGMVQEAPVEAEDKARRIAALKGSLGRLALITPALCDSYLRAWAADCQAWQWHLQDLRPTRHRTSALAALSREGAPRLNFRLGSRSRPPQRPASPGNRKALSGTKV